MLLDNIEDKELKALMDKLRIRTKGVLLLRKSLYFYSLGLETLPNALFDLTHIERLDLSRNKFSELPDGIGRLSNLTYLDLSFNNLTKLPDSLFNLRKLSVLNLRGNSINQHLINRYKFLLPNCEIRV